MHQLSREAHWFVCCGLIVICSCAILFPISSCQFLDIQFNESHKQEKSVLRHVMVLLYGQFSQHWCQKWAVDEEYKLQDFAQVIKRWFFFLCIYSYPLFMKSLFLKPKEPFNFQDALNYWCIADRITSNDAGPGSFRMHSSLIKYFGT